MQLLLLALTVAAANYTRFALGPFQETLRAALQLSDNQIALLQGPALSIPVVLAAIPLGFVVDRTSRVRLLGVFAIIDAGGSLLTGVAASFVTLFIVRCLTGLAAAATMTAAFSLLADNYPAEQRGRANMCLVLGQVAGSSAAYAVGGLTLSHYLDPSDHWRSAMLMLSLPLLPLGLLPFSLREPVRKEVSVKNLSAAHATTHAARNAAHELWQHRATLLPLLTSVVMVSIAECAALIWAAPAFSRHYGLSPSRVGALMALALLVSGVTGAVAGGVLTDFAQKNGGPARTVSLLTKLLLLSLPAGLFGIMPEPISAAILLIVFMTVGTVIGIAAVTLATVVMPNEIRGLFLALLFAAGTVFGMGLAPVAVSVLSGMIGGVATIGTALSAFCVAASLLGTLTLLFGRRAFPAH